jgi:excisionase family DNA binding protein
MSDDVRWRTVAEIVDELRVHEQTVRRWIREGQLRAYNFGGKTGYRIKEEDFETFLEARAEVPQVGKIAA